MCPEFRHPARSLAPDVAFGAQHDGLGAVELEAGDRPHAEPRVLAKPSYKMDPNKGPNDIGRRCAVQAIMRRSQPDSSIAKKVVRSCCADEEFSKS